jgi:hypothetical protein
MCESALRECNLAGDRDDPYRDTGAQLHKSTICSLVETPASAFAPMSWSRQFTPFVRHPPMIATEFANEFDRRPPPDERPVRLILQGRDASRCKTTSQATASPRLLIGNNFLRKSTLTCVTNNTLMPHGVRSHIR